MGEDNIFGNTLNKLKSESNYHYSTSIPHFDVYLGRGLCSGKIYEIFGYESTGKSTIAEFLSIAFLTQQKNGYVLWLESEYVMDRLRFKYMGGDLDRIIIHEVQILEEGFQLILDTIEKSIKSKIPLMVVWDTIAAVVPKDNSGGIGHKPKLIREYLRRLVDSLAESDSIVLFVNQVYEVIGQMSGPKAPGGLGIRFHASLRSKIKKTKRITKTIAGMVIEEASHISLQSVKSKLMYPNLVCDLYMHNELGIMKWESIALFLKNSGMASPKSGGWSSFSVGDKEIKFQSGAQLQQFSEKNEKFDILIDYLVYHKYSTISPLIKMRLFDDIKKMEGEISDLYELIPIELSEEESIIANAVLRNIAND